MRYIILLLLSAGLTGCETLGFSMSDRDGNDYSLSYDKNTGVAVHVRVEDGK